MALYRQLVSSTADAKRTVSDSVHTLRYAIGRFRGNVWVDEKKNSFILLSTEIPHHE